MAIDRRCPFDLQRLLPIPAPILQPGPDGPEAEAWLRAQWGTRRALRHVRELPAAEDRRRRRMGEMRVEFWSADWSPWQALLHLRQAWPSLTLDLVPDYASAGDALRPSIRRGGRCRRLSGAGATCAGAATLETLSAAVCYRRSPRPPSPLR